MNFGGLATARHSDCLITVFFANTGSVLIHFAKGRINLNKEIFFCVGYQHFQDILENILSAPELAFVINPVPVTEIEVVNHATRLHLRVSTRLR